MEPHNIPVIDLHGDLYSHFTRARMNNEVDIFKRYHLKNFEKGNVKFGIFNIWIDDETIDSKTRIVDILTYASQEVLENKEILNQVYSKDDFNKLEPAKVNFMIGLEGLDYLDNANQIYLMYALGARLISLTWNNNNIFASSCTSQVDSGLTLEGFKAVEIMNDLGIIIDISHLSDKSSFDLIQSSRYPVIASHSNVRSICDKPRNLSDELIIAIAKSGGVIGMNAYPNFVSNDSSLADNDYLISHILHIKHLVGIDYIALGFDFMDYLADDALTSFIEGSPYMGDLKNHADIQTLINRLFEVGFTEMEVKKIAYKNAARVINAVLK